MGHQLNSRDKTAIFFVVFPGCERFITEFSNSVLSQTYQSFDMVVVDDGCQMDWSQKFEHTVHTIPGTCNIARNRELGIRCAQDLNYDHLILCDVDDYFHLSRFEKIIEALDEFDCVTHDLNIVSNNSTLLCKDYFQKSHDIPHILPNGYIDERNLCGFSNSGINLKKIKLPSFYSDMQIIDWYIFSVFLESGMKIGFLPDSLTNYRQHGENLIGIGDFTLDSFRKLLPMKIKHYLHLKSFNDRFGVLYNKYVKMLNASDEEISKAIIKNKKEIQYPLWWENIRL